MARFKDRGAYKAGNVRICANKNNVSERKRVTKKSNHRRLAIRLIRRGVTLAEAARTLKESHQLVRYWILSAGINPRITRRNRAKALLRNGK